MVVVGNDRRKLFTSLIDEKAKTLILKELYQGISTKNSWEPVNLVHYVNALYALPSILRYYLVHKNRLALKIINLAKEKRNSRAFAMLLQAASQLLPNL